MKHFVTMQHKTLLLGALLIFVTYGTGVSQTVDYSALSKAELQNKIVSFELGFDAYVIGRVLTTEQLTIAEKNNDDKAYPGTIKFKDGDLFVIADKKSNVVIALYKRNRKADKNDFKIMISELMLQYGEPTTEAHGKTIYWNYGADGLISEELYRTVKSQGQLETLIVLATVKFSSSENVETITNIIDMMEKKKAGEEVKEADVTSDNYLMIQSDILSKKYMEK